MVTLKAKAMIDLEIDNWIDFDFGRVQGEMRISATGKAARALKLKDGEKVEISIKKL